MLIAYWLNMITGCCHCAASCLYWLDGDLSASLAMAYDRLWGRVSTIAAVGVCQQDMPRHFGIIAIFPDQKLAGSGSCAQTSSSYASHIFKVIGLWDYEWGLEKNPIGSLFQQERHQIMEARSSLNATHNTFNVLWKCVQSVEWFLHLYALGVGLYPMLRFWMHVCFVDNMIF